MNSGSFLYTIYRILILKRVFDNFSIILGNGGTRIGIHNIRLGNISQHVALRSIASHWVASRQVVLRGVVSCCVTVRQGAPRHVMSRHIASRHVTSHPFASHRVKLLRQIDRVM